MPALAALSKFAPLHCCRPLKNVSVEKSYEERVCDIHRVVYVDSNILNYSQTLPGKLLGSTLSVGNYTDAE